jgi:glycosyltransferase 2 family protein
VTRSTLFTIVKIAVAAALIWWVLSLAGGWRNVQQSMEGIRLDIWVLGSLCLLLATCLSILRWFMLMRSVGVETTAWTVFRLGWIGVFFNNALPGLTGGDLAKAIYATRDHPNQRTDAVISVIVDRVIGIVALALIAAVVIPFDFSRYGQVAIGIYGFLAVAALGALVTLSRRVKSRLRASAMIGSLLAFARGVGERLRRVAERLGRKPKRAAQSRDSLLGKIDRAVSIYRHRLGTLAIAMMMSIVVHMLLIVGMWFFGEALAAGAHDGAGSVSDATRQQLESLDALQLSVYCSIIPIIMMVSSLPLAPGGWGVGETAFGYFFKLVGVGLVAATALSLTFRLTTMLISLIGGVFLALDRKRVLESLPSSDASSR